MSLFKSRQFSLKEILLPKIFLASVAVGFICCVLLGHLVSQSPALKTAKRFNHLLNPMSYFYPTASQVRARVLSQIKEDQTLVLVGGNSNFNGVGQFLEDLWSTKLQEQLGDKYAVVNLATMGSCSADFAGVIFRMIEPIHKKTLFVYNVYSNSQATIDGSEQECPFHYFFWDAYFKNLVPMSPEIDVATTDKKGFLDLNKMPEMHLGLYMDSFLYSRDLWTYVGYKYFFTVWSSYTTENFSTPREYFTNSSESFFNSVETPEQRKLRYANLDERLRRSGMTTEMFMSNLRRQIDSWAQNNADGGVIENSTWWNRWRNSYLANMPLEQREKTLVAVLWSNPRFVKMLTPEEQKQYNFLIPHAVTELKKLGYESIDIGKNYDPEDFDTSFHYVDTGGAKIAADIASEISKLHPVN
jgi:hypothetical protein